MERAAQTAIFGLIDPCDSRGFGLERLDGPVGDAMGDGEKVRVVATAEDDT